MEVLAHEQQLCPCYKDYQQFQKVLEVSNSGVEIYWHRICTDNIKQGEAIGSSVNSSTDVFIIHNKKDVKITTSQLKLELENKYISCLRCRKILEQAQGLMKDLKSIDKKVIMGVCDHCRNRALFKKKSYCVCDKIVKIFKSFKTLQTEDVKKILKVWPSKKEHVCKDTPVEIRAYSNQQINKDFTSPAARNESEDHSLRPKKTTFDYTPHEIIDTKKLDASSEGFDTSLVKTNVGVKELSTPSIIRSKQEEIFQDTPSRDAKEELKRRHDLSLRQMMKLKKNSELAESKLPDHDGTTKVASNELTLKYDIESEMDIKKIPKTPHDLDVQQQVKQLEQRGLKSKRMEAEFSYVFPKTKEKKVNKINVQSSELIKTTREKLKERRQQQEQNRKLSQEKKKSQAGEQTKVAEGQIKVGGEQTKVRGEQTKIGGEQTKVGGEQTKVGGEQTKFGGEQTKFGGKQTKVGGEQTKVGGEQTKVGGKQTKVGGEQTKVAGERTKVAGEQTKVSGKQAKVAEEQRKQVEKDKPSKDVLEKKNQTEVAKKDSNLKPKDEVKGSSKEKDEGSTKGKKLKAVEDEMAKSGKEDKSKPEKGESDQKLKRGKQEDKRLSKKTDKILKKLQMEKERLIKEEQMKEKVVPSKKGKATKTKPESSSLTEISSSDADSIDIESKKTTRKKKEGKGQTEKKLTAKERRERGQFAKLHAMHVKAKEEALKKKQELEAQKASEEAARELKMTNKLLKQAKSSDYLQLVKLKHSKKIIRPIDIDFELLRAHTAHNKRGRQILACPLCWDSDLELEVYSRLDIERNKIKDPTAHIIIGEKIYKYKPHIEKPKKAEISPIYFQKDIFLETDLQLKEMVRKISQEPEPVKKRPLDKDLSKKDDKEAELEIGKGVIRYALSDRSFIDKGWTVLPTEKVVRMMNVYRMRPAHPEFDWFEHNKNKRLMTYDTGERLAEFDDNGRGRWYYRSGRLALDYYDAEEINAKQRFVVYSSGEPDERGRTYPITILATFDYLGNGIVLDHAGKIRLKYNQSEGVVLDRAIGPISHWKWHTLNDPPVLQQVMIDTQMAHKDPYILKLGSSDDAKPRPDNEEMLAIEFDNFIKDKTKKLSQKLEPFQIKMKALKINEHFSLKVLDQARIYLIFRDGLTNLKVNMGMILDHKEIVDTDTAEVGQVSNSLERFPARTDSLAGLQRSVAHAQRYERQHAERNRRLHFTDPCASADLITAATSPPMRLPLRTVPTISTSATRYCSRKPSNNLYYDTRLFC
ncbi:hypothetical protein PYW08_007123 [Mythimna loreyi]|uniref:Uncharacterized protein n=1 Tax=Mythimna loreyi TaxID=667449 RepID=A0ACC2R8Z5_9NEOP|nr:hypothetical protein PYW08_007123 [Mythimna loreyi]